MIYSTRVHNSKDSVLPSPISNFIATASNQADKVSNDKLVNRNMVFFINIIILYIIFVLCVDLFLFSHTQQLLVSLDISEN